MIFDSNNATISIYDEEYLKRIHPEFAPAVAFCFAYYAIGVIDLICYVREAITTHLHVYILIFCILRTISFGVRSAWAATPSELSYGTTTISLQTAGLFILIIFSIEVLKCWMLSCTEELTNYWINPANRIKLFFILRISGPLLTILGIVGVNLQKNSKTQKQFNKATIIREASDWGFFILVCIFTVLSISMTYVVSNVSSFKFNERILFSN